MFKKIMAHGSLGCMMHDFAPLCPFRSIWRVRNRRAFEVVKAWIKQLKVIFYIFFFGIGLDCTLGMVLCNC